MGSEPKPNSFRALVIRGERPPLVVTEKEHRLDGDCDRLDAVAVSRTEVRRGNHRSNDRHGLAGEDALARYHGQTHTVKVVNLSAGGAMIRADFEPLLWDFVELHLGESASVDCAVRWLRGGCIGLEFAHETRIDSNPEERAALLLEVIQRSFPGQSVTLKHDEPAAAEALVEELGHRIERRHPLIWNGELHSANGRQPVRIRNISPRGALVDVAAEYSDGASVVLDLGEAGQLGASVTWATGAHAGLKFDLPFDLSDLSKSRPEVTSHQWLVPDFLESSDEETSPWHENWSRSSIEDLRSDLEGYLKH